MLLLDTYKNNNTDNGIDYIINTFIIFHELMITLFCVSQDTEYIPTTMINGYSENNTYNYQFIYNIMYDNDLLDEINTFYNRKTFLFHPDKLYIDKMLDFKISVLLEEGSYCRYTVLNLSLCC